MTHCESHSEHHPKCPHCQYKLAEFWANILGEACRRIEPFISKEEYEKGWQFGDEFIPFNEIVDYIIHPTRAFKVWAWAEEQGWEIEIQSSLVQFRRKFYNPIFEYHGQQVTTQTYSFKDDGGKPIAILLAASEVPEKEKR